MMKIPKFLCRNKVTIKPFEGDGAYGPVYGTEYTAKCYIEPNRKLLQDDEGNEIISNTLAIFRDKLNIPEQSIITWNSKEYTVEQTKPFYPLGKFSHLEVYLL